MSDSMLDELINNSVFVGEGTFLHPEYGSWVYVCELCGQPLASSDLECHSGYHVGPNGTTVGQRIPSLELAMRMLGRAPIPEHVQKVIDRGREKPDHIQISIFDPQTGETEICNLNEDGWRVFTTDPYRVTNENHFSSGTVQLTIKKLFMVDGREALCSGDGWSNHGSIGGDSPERCPGCPLCEREGNAPT